MKSTANNSTAVNRWDKLQTFRRKKTVDKGSFIENFFNKFKK